MAGAATAAAMVVAELVESETVAAEMAEAATVALTAAVEMAGAATVVATAEAMAVAKRVEVAREPSGPGSRARSECSCRR
jgi:hypothetical protein